MKIFGWEIKRANLSPPNSGRWVTIQDPYPGAWQQDQSIELDTVLSFSAVFACVRLITSDIGKMRIRLMRRQPSGFWKEEDSPLFSPVLKKPNSIQTRIKFIEQWLISKLLHGNAYVIKRRGANGIVRSMQVLDPTRVQTLVSESGEAFYRLQNDPMVAVREEITVPGTEIIHDVHVTPDHPLVGVSPILASGLTAAQGLAIQKNSKTFFANMARPSGILTAPGKINDETAERLKNEFQARYGGENIGRVAVAGDGLKFDPITMTAVDAQVIEQLQWTAVDVCRAFGVPGYKVGVGPTPTYNNIGALNQAYYDDCLQELIACIELLLDEGLALPDGYKTEFDIEQLLRMDTRTRYAAHKDAIAGGWKAPNEARIKEGYEPVEGGEEPIMQQQNWPLSVLARRPPPDSAPPEQDETDKALWMLESKRLEGIAHEN